VATSVISAGSRIKVDRARAARSTRMMQDWNLWPE
jgi:hypothetical protein